MSLAFLRHPFILASLVAVLVLLGALGILVRAPSAHASVNNLSLTVYAQQNGADVTSVVSGSTVTVHWSTTQTGHLNLGGEICDTTKSFNSNPAASNGASGTYTQSITQTTTFYVSCGIGASTVYGQVTVNVYPTHRNSLCKPRIHHSRPADRSHLELN